MVICYSSYRKLIQQSCKCELVWMNQQIAVLFLLGSSVHCELCGLGWVTSYGQGTKPGQHPAGEMSGYNCFCKEAKWTPGYSLSIACGRDISGERHWLYTAYHSRVAMAALTEPHLQFPVVVDVWNIKSLASGWWLLGECFCLEDSDFIKGWTLRSVSDVRLLLGGGKVGCRVSLEEVT